MPDTTTPNPTIAGRLLEVLPRLHHTLKRDRQRSELADPSAHSFSDRAGQFRALVLLYKAERLTSHQLAERMEVSAPTVSTMVRSLAEQGMVGRERDAGDQRVVWLTITDAGREAVEEERRRWREVFLQRLERLDETDQRLIADAIPALERLVSVDGCRKED